MNNLKYLQNEIVVNCYSSILAHSFLEKKEQGYKDRDLCPFIHYMDMPIDDIHFRIRILLKLFNQVTKLNS